MDGSNDTFDMSAFLASSIHDMKNSVSVLIATLEDELAKCDAHSTEYLRLAPMLYEVKRVNNNLIQLLTVYKANDRFYPFDSDEHSVSDFVEEVVSQAQSLLDYKHIELDLECDDIYWYFDRELVSGVIGHALNNAAHYTKGKLKLKAVAAPEGWLEFRIEDNGAGYPQKMLDEGNGLGKSVNFATGSTGLGLYFSALVARMHTNQGREGHICLENGGAYNGGCFILRLP